ncbi:MAG: DNA polymerase I [Lachnospiraceae bacterium]|nr:DNA polymerase I [Lachnospiraceae bacterium]
MKKIVLIDGHSILHRTFYGIPDLSNAEGLHTNAIYGFLNILFKILDEEQPEYLTVAFDVHAPTFRHKLFEAYKGTRKPMPEELREQVPVMKEVLKAMGIQVVEQAGYEADDLLGTMAGICEKQGMQVTILSGDRDLLQLATKQTMIRIPKTKRGGTEIEDYLEEQVREKYQVTPQEFIEVKALMGDSSDNIPGVSGIGEKTATRLIVQYKSVQGVYDHLEEMKASKMKTNLEENRELAFLSRQLVEICTSCEVDFQLEQAEIKNFYTPEAYQLFQKLEFKHMLNRFEQTEKAFSIEEHMIMVQELAEAEAVFAKAYQAKKTALHIVGWDGQAVAAVLAMDEEQVYYIQQGYSLVSCDYLIDKCIDICKRDGETIIYDVKQMMRYLGEDSPSQVWKNIKDAGLMAYLLNPLKDIYGYEEIAREYAGLYLPSQTELLGKQSIKEAYEKNNSALAAFACTLVYALYHSMDSLYKKLEEWEMKELYHKIELPLAVSLFRMEQAGICAQRETLEVYGKELGVKIEQIQARIYQMVGKEFNINSPKQLGDILFEEMKLPNGKKTKNGYSTAADVLEKLRGDYEVVDQILEYRQLSKLKSTYADGLVPCIHEDGRIHSTFNQKVTATGRISSTEPNLQNIPVRMELGRQIRRVFVPAEHCVFIDADYSQIELRVLAHMSGDEKLIEAFNQERDIHSTTAAEVFHVPLEEVTPLQRRNAKAVNFGIVYGISAHGLSEDLGCSRKEAQEYIDNYFVTYPKIKAFLDQLIQNAKEKGYVSSLFGRRRPVPELHSSNYMTRSFGERVAMNAPIQGTAADIIKMAMVQVDQRMANEGLSSRLILQVHDELLIEAPEEEKEQVKAILQEEMEHAALLHVKLLVDMHEGSSWYEAK